MKHLLWSFLVLFMLSGVSSASATDTVKGDPIPNHHRISDSPYVITSDGKTLYHVGTGESIPLSRELYFNFSHQLKGVMSTDQQHIVFTISCSDCSTSRYVIGLDGQVDSKSFPESYRLAGADVANDRVLWTSGPAVIMTDVEGNIVWERTDIGSNVALSKDRTTVIAAATDLGEISHLAVATGETLSTKRFETLTGWSREALAFDGVIIYQDFGYLYNEATRTLTALQVPYGSVQFTEQDGVIHWSGQGEYHTYDVATGVAKSFQTIVHPNLYPGVLSFSDRTIPISAYPSLPTKLEVVIDRSANTEGDPFLYVGRDYPIYMTATGADGTMTNIPFDQLKQGKNSNVVSPLRFTYATQQNYDVTYLGKSLLGTLSSTREGQVSLNKYGLAGEIVGQTSPRANITIRVLQPEGEPTVYSGTATSTGEFRIKTAALTPGTTFTVSSTGGGYVVYRKPFVVPTPNPEANTIAVVSDSVESGVAFKTVPNGKIDLYVIEYAHRYYETIQADANGIARLTDTVDPLAKGVEIQYAPAGTEGVEKKLIVYERAEPIFSLAGTPNGGDTTIALSSTAQATTFTHSVNGQLVGTGKTVTLATPLQDGDVIKIVAKAGDREKTLEHRVVAVGPSMLQVTDVAMTATHTVVSVRRDTRAVLQFFINGKLTTATPVSSTRFTVPAKPGDIVLVRVTRGGLKLDTRLALPQVTFSNIRLHDEQKTWVGMVLPNSFVTLQNGTKQITSGKSSSTGRVVMGLAPQPLHAKITLVSTRGVYRFVQTVNVKAGLTPVMKVAAPTNTARTVTVNSNIDYGTITIHRGTTLLATKSVTSKSTPVAIAAQKSGTRLTIKLTTPKGRSQTVYVTVR